MTRATWLIEELKNCPKIPPNGKPCHFGCEDSVGVFYTPNGCQCFPHAKTMFLCVQHAVGLGTDYIEVVCGFSGPKKKPKVILDNETILSDDWIKFSDRLPPPDVKIIFKVVRQVFRYCQVREDYTLTTIIRPKTERTGVRRNQQSKGDYTYDAIYERGWGSRRWGICNRHKELLGWKLDNGGK